MGEHDITGARQELPRFCHVPRVCSDFFFLKINILRTWRHKNQVIYLDKRLNFYLSRTINYWFSVLKNPKQALKYELIIS